LCEKNDRKDFGEHPFDHKYCQTELFLMIGRRELFESQLRDLQCDISNLSDKLQTSPSKQAVDKGKQLMEDP